MCNINIARKEGGNSLVCAGYDDGSIQVFRCVLLLLFVFLFVVVIFAVAFVFIICCGCFALFCFSLLYSFLLTVMNLFLFFTSDILRTQCQSTRSGVASMQEDLCLQYLLLADLMKNPRLSLLLELWTECSLSGN